MHDATTQPHFDRCVIQNLNFPVFDETENCQFHIFRFLVKKNNFVAATSASINNCTDSISEKEKEKPSLNIVNTLLWRVACFLTTNDHYFLTIFNLPPNKKKTVIISPHFLVFNFKN